jgi:hypothetical protein
MSDNYHIEDQTIIIHAPAGNITMQIRVFGYMVTDMLKGRSKYDMFSYIQQQHPEATSEDIVSILDAIVEYIADTYREKNLDNEKKLRLAQLEHLYQIAVSKEDTRSAESILMKIIDFTGLANQMESVIDEWKIDFGEPLNGED